MTIVDLQYYAVNSRLADTPLLQTLAITDKIQIPSKRSLTANDSWYYRLSLLRLLYSILRVFATTRVDCILNFNSVPLPYHFVQTLLLLVLVNQTHLLIQHIKILLDLHCHSYNYCQHL